jgi:hypothetical protein
LLDATRQEPSKRQLVRTADGDRKSWPCHT